MRSTMTLTASPLGGVWGTSNPVIATVSSGGVVSGLSGTATDIISYTLPDGCYTTKNITVNAVPSISFGSHTLCVGTMDTLYTSRDSIAWTSSNTGVATVYGYHTLFLGDVGIVTGISPGTSVITFDIPSTGCTSTFTVTVNPTPSLTGTLSVCTTFTTALSASLTGGTWTTSDATIATVNSLGLVTGINSGTAIIDYQMPGTGCFASVIVTVNPLPDLILPTSVCVGYTTTLTDGGGGTWISTTTSIATIGSTTGLVTGISTGNDIITYTLPGTGCYTTTLVTVKPVPGPITGTLTVCSGSTTALGDIASGGVWDLFTPPTATISITGVVSGGTVSVPTTATVMYTEAPGCFVTAIFTVNPLPVITGADSVCIGSSITLTGTPTGGTWTTSTPTLISIVGSVVTGTNSGTAIVSYTLPDGCAVVIGIEVNILPNPITGPSQVCQFDSITLADVYPGGTWSSYHTGIATVGATGVVTGISPGIDTIVYTIPTGGCTATHIVTVNPGPGPITGTFIECQGVITTLSDATSSGIWSTTPITGSVIITSSGVVTAIGSGTALIKYTLTGGCFSSVVFTINPVPAAISGPPVLCVGSTATYTDITPSGTWTVTNSHATIDLSLGNLYAVSPGLDTIIYTLPTGCVRTIVITINPLPAPITGPDSVCVAAMIHLSDATTGGTWTCLPIAIATTDAGGHVTGVSGGYAVVTYTTSGVGCSVTDTIKVNTPPVVPPITGDDTAMCVGGHVIYSDALAGGTWLSSDATIASVSPTGFITGITLGTAIISYSVTNSCGTTTVTKPVYVVTGIPAIPPITGWPGVCSGSTDTLADAYPGGTWSCTPPGIVTIDPATGIVSGLGTGEVTITYTATGICHTGFVTRTIKGNMLPYITTNSHNACSYFGSGPAIYGYALSDSSCTLVCDSSTMRYYGNGNSGSIFTWTVIGGVVEANYGDSIDVFWPVTGTVGTITLSDTFSHCIGTTSACIQVIAKPHAFFVPSTINICLGGSILFTDHSSADSLSPIVSWNWYFGDGTASADEVPPAHIYTAAGTYTAFLVVKNACGCGDTFRVNITVSDLTGPKIVCPSIVCDSEIAVYSTSTACASYAWSVSGGTIISGTGTASIQVRWDHPPADGFGTVRLSVPCTGVCSSPVSIRVPIILQNPAISGPDVICAGQQAEYSLPLWPATQYMWGALGSHASIVSPNNDYKVLVDFTTPGTYTLHAWFQNELKLCGANVDKTITVVEPTAIVGPTTVCQFSTDTFLLADHTLAGNWTLSDFSGSVVAVGTGSSFSSTFNVPGVYFLNAIGTFCTNPLTIYVPASPNPIDSIAGKDTVCLNHVYSYTAYPDVPGTTYTWSAVGGTVSPASGSATVTATWTSYGTKQLIVTRLLTSAPYCASLPDTINIVRDMPNPLVAGNTSPCSNGFENYTATYLTGDSYDWVITPSSAGSVTGGNHTATPTILWNNTFSPLSASIAVTVHKCDTIAKDTLNVVLRPATGMALTPLGAAVCPLSPITFTATTGDGTYIWTFGDGSPGVTTTSNTTTHSFPANPTTGNMAYVVTVSGIPTPGSSCAPFGTATLDVTVLPAPVAYASSASATICVGGTALIVGTVTDNITSLSYQWYSTPGGTITGATGITYTATTIGSYYFTVLGSDGCTGTSNTYTLVDCPADSSSGGGGSGGSGGSGGGTGCSTPLAVSVSTADTCRSIYLYGNSYGTSPQWSATVLPASGVIPPGINAVVTYDTPGIYHFAFDAAPVFPDVCPAHTDVVDTVGIVANYRYWLKCGIGANDSLFLADNSAFLPFWHIDTIIWSDGGGIIGGGENLSVVHNRSTPYTVTETVSGTRPGGTFSCTYTRTIVFPPLPTAAFTDAISPICAGVPITFTPSLPAGLVGYEWEFGDSATSLLNITERTYDWITPGAPHIYSVTLIVTDTIGCVDSIIHNVGIYENLLATHDIYGGSGAICSSALPFPESIFVTPGGGTAPYTYLWSDGITSTSTFNIYTSGSYWVAVTDAHGCRQAFFPAQNIRVLQPPTPVISGLQYYCIGNPVQLSGYAGPGVSYQWLRNGTGIGTGPSITHFESPGTYAYQLVLGITDTATSTTCYDTSAADSIQVFGLPPAPVITGPNVVDCGLYHLQLVASEPTSGTYNWSDGTYGAVDDIYSGGPYRVWFTDLDGCVSESDITVPMSADSYFPYFPTGCYTFCAQQLPITLYGPPNVIFNNWAWLRNGSVALSGAFTPMSPYVLNSAGAYQWSLDNGLCPQTSDTMEVTDTVCVTCQQDPPTISIACESGNPASYSLTITYTSTMPVGTTYTIGTDIGPIDPFSGTLSGASAPYTLTLTFTTLLLPPPDSVTVETIFTEPDGTKCVSKERVFLVDTCRWIDERQSAGTDTAQHNVNKPITSATAMLVYPNPASGVVTVSYDYGSDSYNNRSLSIYDALGRKKDFTTVQDVHGNWTVNTKDWTSGVYIIRMEADGQVLHTQRLVVVSK